jgi:small-conductance mechanosensitive channel
MSTQEVFNWSFAGNTVWAWGSAAALTLIVWTVLGIAKRLLLRYVGAIAQKTETQIDDMLIDMLRRTKFFFFLLISIYAGLQVLALPEGVDSLIHAVAVIVFFAQAAVWGNGLITFWLDHYAQTKLTQDLAGITTLKGLGFLARLGLWTTIALLTLDNLGIDITALVAGLGVGGIAVALAVQNVLVDLFASLSIIFDKPFMVGDFIVVGDVMGTVEHIGLKTTRIRSLSGEEIVMANSNLLGSQIRNYKRMFERRVLFMLGVTYQTPHEKLQKIPQIVREIVEAQPLARFDRSHFSQYGDFSLNFETVYFVKDPDYNKYMDTHQAVNLALYKKFAEEGIEFAYPTQTLFLVKANANPS